MKRLRVAIITTDGREMLRRYEAPGPIFGTAPRALLDGLSEIPDVDIHVLSCVQKPVRSQRDPAPNITLHSLHVPKRGWMRTAYLGCARAVRARLREIQPDIVHGQGTERDCAVSAVRSGFRNVLTLHGSMAEMARKFSPKPFSFGWWAPFFEAYAVRRTEGVFCNSTFTEQLMKREARRTWKVPNALRKEFVAPVTQRAPNPLPTLLNVGVICTNKRQLEILRICRRLHGKGLKFMMRFVGQADPHDPCAREFLREIALANSSGYASFEGLKQEVTDLIACMDQSDLLVHFPLVETFGLVVAEALARGLDLISCKVGGISDVTAGIGSIRMLEPGDLAGLEDAISKWILRPGRGGSDARQSMLARYHPKAVAESHVDIYRDVLSRPR